MDRAEEGLIDYIFASAYYWATADCFGRGYGWAVAWSASRREGSLLWRKARYRYGRASFAGRPLPSLRGSAWPVAAIWPAAECLRHFVAGTWLPFLRRSWPSLRLRLVGLSPRGCDWLRDLLLTDDIWLPGVPRPSPSPIFGDKLNSSLALRWRAVRSTERWSQPQAHLQSPAPVAPAPSRHIT